MSTPHRALGTALALAVATIAGAWAFQLFGDLQPCALCLTQRIPYYAGIPVLVLALIAHSWAKTRLMMPALALIAACIFVLGAGYGAYHSGVEWQWWPGPATCAASGGPAAAVGDLLSQLETVRIVPCDKVQWRFAGLTFANYNVLISLAITGLCVLAALRVIKR